MKRLIYIISMILLLLVGCRQGSVDSAGLVELDSLIATAPDSAAALLQAYPTDSLRTDADRAYHALLLTQARYKAYIPATSDSDINVAVEYFVINKRGDYDRRIRSLIYKGCVMTELGQPDSAVLWFKQAENIARPEDHSNLGYINFWMGRVYQSQFSDINIIIQKYQNSISHYDHCNDSTRLLYCLMEIGGVYINENTDSAIKYISSAKQLALLLNDSVSYSSCLTKEAYLCSLNGDHINANRLIMSVLSSSSALSDSVEAIMIASMSFAKLGQNDSANFFGNHLHLPEDSASQVLYYDMRAQICQAQGDKLGFVTNMRQSEAIAGDLLSRSLQHKLSDIENESRLNTAIAESRLDIQRSRFVAFIAVLLFVFLCITGLYWRKKQKLEVVKKQNEISSLLYELEKLSQQETKLEDSNNILTQRVAKAESDLTDMQSRLEHKQQIIDRKDKRIGEIMRDSANLHEAQEMEKRMSKSLEYIAGILHHFIMQSHELKPSEFLDKFRNGFLESPHGGETDFWGMLQTQVDSIYKGALKNLLTTHPQLTTKDIRIICMMALGFSSEMMATCLQHKANYIETLKNRLKTKKLGIDITIIEYLKQFADTPLE